MGFDKQKDRALVQASLCFISYQIFMWWFSSRNFKIFYFTIGSGFWDHFFYYSQIWNVKIYPISKRQIFCQLLLENFCHSNCLQQCLSNSICIEKSFSQLKMYTGWKFLAISIEFQKFFLITRTFFFLTVCRINFGNKIPIKCYLGQTLRTR